MSESKKRALAPVVPNILFSLSQIVLHTCLPQVIIKIVCSELGYSGIDCDSAIVSQQAAKITLYASLVVGVPALLIVGFYGSFANRYGLKQTLVIPVLGNFVYLSCQLLALRNRNIYLHILLFGSLISGLTGNRNTFVMASFVYAADYSTPEDRSDVFSILEAGIYFSRVVGPLLVGVVAKVYGFQGSLVVGLLLCVSAFLWILVVMENPPLIHPHRHRSSRANFAPISRQQLIEETSSSTMSTPLLVKGVASSDGGTMTTNGGWRSEGFGDEERGKGKALGYGTEQDQMRSGSRQQEQQQQQQQQQGVVSGQNGSSSSSSSSSSINGGGGIIIISSSSSGSSSSSTAIGHGVAGQTSFPPHRTPEGTSSTTPPEALPALDFHPLATFRTVTRLFGTSPLGDASVPPLALAYFIFYLVSTGEFLIEILYQKHRFHFSPLTIGYYGSVSGTMMVLSMVAMPRVCVWLLGTDLTDLTWIEAGIWTRVLFYFLFGLADRGFELFLLLPLLLPSGTIVPRARAYLSKSVTSKSSVQTDMFATIAALEATAILLAPVFPYVYSQSVALWPGLPFEVSAAMCVVTAGIMRWVRERAMSGSHIDSMVIV